ncbi:MAG: hypothetical protein LBE80_00280 [Deltaproteobacteria bacterium]|jgi:hypothetical protein|nr:hypothetical protein [Deltaproteobacteria bacterium]
MLFPLCVYGKMEKHGKPGAHYAIINCHKDFGPEALKIFHQVRRSFNWRGRAGERFETGQAYWPMGEMVGLSLRFIDVGRDYFGRPHTLRLEAALVREKSWLGLKGYLGLGSWPKELCLADQVDLAQTDEIALLRPPSLPVFIVKSKNLDCPLIKESFF